MIALLTVLVMGLVIWITTIPCVWFRIAPSICKLLGGHRWRDIALYDGTNKSDACRYCARCARTEER